jgi:WXG100 family type VII secretion target
MANVNVTYQSLHDQAVKLANGRQEIENQLSALKSQVDALVAEGFVTDAASKSFQNSYEEFTQGATKTIHGLDGMSSYLKTAAQTFQDVDQQLASALNH